MKRPGHPSARRRAVVLLAVAAALTACSTTGVRSDEPRTTVGTLGSGTKVTITWWTGQADEGEQILEGLAKDYESQHPNVTIDVSSGAATTDDLLQKLQAGFAAGSYPDISYAYGSWASELGASGRTLDVSQQVKAEGSGWNEFPKAARETATVDGVVVGLPAVVDNLGLIYNTKLFDAAGLSYPTDKWTWDDFRAAAKALTIPSQNQYGTAYPVSGSEDTVWRFYPQLWQNGGQVLTADNKPAFNSDAGVKALTLWQQMAVDDKSVYLDQNGEKYPGLFYSSHMGMMISGPWELFELKKHNTPYGVTILPGTDGDHQTISGPDLWVLLDHQDSARAAASYDFVHWLTSPEQDVRWNIAYGNLPLRSSAADTPQFKAYVAKYPGAQVFFDNLQNAVNARPTIQGYTAMSRDLGTAISKVLLGAAEPEQALDQAASQAEVDLQQ
jgi:multiple sugar transport system substrate-binding protein